MTADRNPVPPHLSSLGERLHCSLQLTCRDQEGGRPQPSDHEKQETSQVRLIQKYFQCNHELSNRLYHYCHRIEKAWKRFVLLEDGSRQQTFHNSQRPNFPQALNMEPEVFRKESAHLFTLFRTADNFIKRIEITPLEFPKHGQCLG